MKKAKIMLAAAALFGMAAVPANALTGTAIYVDSQYLNSDSMPEIVENTTFVPLRAVSEALGASVDWANGQAIVVQNGKKITMLVGQKFADVNGEAVELLAAPFVQSDRVFVPLRFVSEQLGAQVEYDNHQIDITGQGEVKSGAVVSFARCGEDENYIYLSENYDGKLTKIDKATGEKTYITLANSSSLLIAPLADMICYQKGVERSDGGYDNYLCASKLDGSDETKLVLNGGTPKIYGEYLYYLVNNTKTFAHDLYRVKLQDGKPQGEVTLVTSYAQKYFFAGDIIYTTSDSGRVFKMNSDGSDHAGIVSPASSEKLYFRAFDNGYFYYSDYDRTKLYRFKQPGVGGGSVWEPVCDFAETQIKRIEDMKICGNRIYFNCMAYVEYTEGQYGVATGALWEMDLDGNNLQQLTEGKALDFYVLQDKIVYLTQTATGTEWKIIDKQ